MLLTPYRALLLWKTCYGTSSCRRASTRRIRERLLAATGRSGPPPGCISSGSGVPLSTGLRRISTSSAIGISPPPKNRVQRSGLDGRRQARPRSERWLLAVGYGGRQCEIRRGSWNEDLFRVLEGSPDFAHGDEVDACSGALEMLMFSSLLVRPFRFCG